MQKTKKRILSFAIALIIIAILVFTVMFVFFGIPDLGRKENNARRWIKANTDIEIPKNSEMVYRYKNKDVFFPVPGRLPRYYVFKFDSEPSEWLEKTSFSKERNKEFESDFNVPDWMIEELSEDYIADFEKPYYWLDAPELIYFVYNPNKLILIVYARPW